MIVQGVYQKGESLPSERELIELTGVSRITVRETLRLLNETGIIKTYKGKGSFVLIDGAFHRALIEVTHNWFDQLSHMETSPAISSLVTPAQQKSVAVKINEQHQNICNALRTRDSEFAYLYMKEHLIFIHDVFEEYFKVFY